MFGIIPRKKKKKSGQQWEWEHIEHTHSYFYSGHKSLSTLTLINWSSSNPPEFLRKFRIKDDYNINSQIKRVHFKMFSGDNRV